MNARNHYTHPICVLCKEDAYLDSSVWVKIVELTWRRVPFSGVALRVSK